MMCKTVALCVLLCVASACRLSPAAAGEVEYLTSAASAAKNLPFSDAVRVGQTLYVSGAIGVAPGTLDLVPGGTAAQAKQALENLRGVLEANGSSLDQVVKVTVMLADIAEWSAFNEVYVACFPRYRPARSAFGANGLALGARVEIDCIATVNG